MNNIPGNRQRLRREETVFRGPNGEIKTQTEEHSVFFNDGNIGSKQTVEIPIVLGKLPHDFETVTAQCQTCYEFATDDMVTACDLCHRILCLPCSRKRNEMTVCPKCAKYIERRRLILIVRKLFLDPFVERKG